ncbi:MAG TPA: hypothetical protein VEI02_16020 [Planctomycetota bacterium]|nr:hypothetical protein [Planctomycetota bacterium]
MRRVLITPPEPPTVAVEVSADDARLPRWVETARRGKFDHVALLGSARLRWERLLGEAPPVDATGAPEAGSAEGGRVEPTGSHDADSGETHDGHEGHDGGDADGSATHVETGATTEPAATGTDAAPAAEAGAPADVASPENAPPSVVAHAAEAVFDAPPAPARPAGPVAKLRKGPPKEPPRDRAELWRRLVFQGQTGRIDPAAMESLGKALAERWQIPSVECCAVAQAQGDRDVASFVRRVAAIPEPGDRVTVDVSEGPRAWVGFGVAAAHTLAAARAEVELEDLILDRRDDGAAASGKGLFPILRSHALLGEMRRGNYSPEIVEELKRDPRAGPLVPVYERFVRGLEFGSPVETARAARALVERSEQIRRDRKQRAFDATDASFGPVVTALLADEPWSRTELAMAKEAQRRRNAFLAASHLREALVSNLLEVFGVAAGKAWAPARAPDGSEGRVRPRDVAAGYLGSAFARDVIPDLDAVWTAVGNPRIRFLLTGPVHQDPGAMRSAAEGLNELIKQTQAILDDGRLKALTVDTPFEKLIAMAVAEGDARVRPLRPGRKGGKAEDDDGHEDEAAPAAPAEGTAGGAAPPAPADARPPRRDRPRGDRPQRAEGRHGGPPRGPRHEGGPSAAHGHGAPQGGGATRPEGPRREDRPREVRVHAPGPRHDGPPTERPRSVPIGGEIKVERARGGLGNLGAALAQAGLVKPKTDGRKEAPRGERPAEKTASHARGEPTPAPRREADADPPAAAEPPAEPAPPTPPAFDVGGPA